MGLLSDLGEILSTEETWKIQKMLRKVGIRQFIKVYKKYKGFQKNIEPKIIKWGQEIQGHFLIKKDNGQLQLCLEPASEQYEGINFPLMLEYGRWMLEMIPSQPYSTRCDFREIVRIIREKYAILQSKSRIFLTIPTIPFLGVISTEQKQHLSNQITQSKYISDKHIADHLRFRTLTKNIRNRRGRNVQINVPIYVDKNTNFEELAQTQPDPHFIYLDAMAFGMGMSCLQCTFSTINLDHARYVYDQMHVLSPLMLAMTAATPFHKGKLADWDARWKIIEGSVDCRNENERNPEHQDYLPTSRYSETSLFIWDGPLNRPQYNDMDTRSKKQTIEYIKEAASDLQVEIDDKLLMHLANIFKRDILIAHQKFKTMTDDQATLFEMLNGTNWNSVRLKIPIDDQIGWRVQFRTMEVQLTADQNSAFSLFIHFFTRILHESTNLNLYIPISLVKKNFDIAHINNAVRKEKFYNRINIFDEGEPIIKMMTLHQIFFGSAQYPNYPGLFPYIKQLLLKECKCNNTNWAKVIDQIQEFIRKITSGQKITLAQWMRRYIDKHPDYKHNSILPKTTMDDLLLTLNQIAKGTLKDENFEPIFSF